MTTSLELIELRTSYLLALFKLVYCVMPRDMFLIDRSIFSMTNFCPPLVESEQNK